MKGENNIKTEGKVFLNEIELEPVNGGSAA